MGWKSVKEHYRIEHSVHVTEQGLCIGSPYIHNIIVIGRDGSVTRRYEGHSNEQLARYQKEFDADPATLKRLVEEQDTFSASIPVYTYEGGQVLEKKCEEIGWPNVTHDGEMMHDNTFSADKATVVKWAKRNADLGIELQRKAVCEAEDRLQDYRGRLSAEIANRERLEADYPDVVVGPKD